MSGTSTASRPSEECQAAENHRQRLLRPLTDASPPESRYSASMSTEAKTTDPQEQADSEAVLRHAFRGEPLDPEVARRVHERAAKRKSIARTASSTTRRSTICSAAMTKTTSHEVCLGCVHGVPLGRQIPAHAAGTPAARLVPATGPQANRPRAFPARDCQRLNQGRTPETHRRRGCPPAHQGRPEHAARPARRGPAVLRGRSISRRKRGVPSTIASTWPWPSARSANSSPRTSRS